MTDPDRSADNGGEGAYSQVADEQLDALARQNADLYNDILTMCEFIFTSPSRAQSMSAAITTNNGIVMRLPVPNRHPYKVFWTTATPRIEAIFPYET